MNFNITRLAGVLGMACIILASLTTTNAGAAEPASHKSLFTNCASIPNNISGFIFMGEYNNSKYYCSSSSNYTWAQAKAAAQAAGGHLACIGSAAENTFIKNGVLNQEAWIGFTDETVEGTWKWYTNDPIAYTFWETGEPNNYNNSDHCILSKTWGKWFDRPGTDKYEFIMEIPCPAPPPPPANACGNGTGDLLVSWGLNACGSPFNSYDEFTPSYPQNGGCSSVTATKVYRNSGNHSCIPGAGGSTAGMCVTGQTTCTFTNNSASAIRFEVTIKPNAGGTATLSGLNFFQQAPSWFQQIGGNNGQNNYPTKFGIRVTKGGTEVFKQTGLTTSQAGWKSEAFNLGTDPDFTVNTATTFSFEILGYCKVGNWANVTLFDIDEVKVFGCCNTPQPCSVNATVSNVQCNDNGTPSISTDDKFSFTLTATGANASSGWTALINGTTVTGVYGTPKNLGPYNISGGNLTFDVKDNSNPACKAAVTVTAPAPCSVPPAPAAYGNFVWNDADQDGTQDATETGVGNVVVKLYKCDGTFVGQTTTNAQGQYSFTNLVPDMQYFAEFSSLPAGFLFTTANAAADNIDSDANATTGKTECTLLSPGETDNNWDAGIYQPAPQVGSIGDFVWLDTDKNGQQDANEPGVPNVTVRLKNCQNAVLFVTQTNANGFYSFTNLPAACYRVAIDLPAGFTSSPQDLGNDLSDSDINPATGMTGDINLGAGQNNLTIDAGIYPTPPPPTASIGDFVWFDTNANGLQDAGEPGIPNSIVILETCTGQFIASTTTNLNGGYLFNNLAAGQYRVKFANPGSFNGLNTTFTISNFGNDDTKDSDADFLGVTGCITLANGQPNTTVDAGFFGQAPPGCDNVTNGGTIGYDEAVCNSFDPANIENIALPTGGTGQIEYMWLASTLGCPDNTVQAIPGANGPSYDPGQISQTTWYIRCTRRVGCTIWIESNCVKKEVQACPGACNITFAGGNNITVNGLTAPVVIVKVFNAAWQQVYTCNGNCANPTVVIGLPAGQYFVDVQMYTANWQPVCANSGYVTVSEFTGNGTELRDGGNSSAAAPLQASMFPNPANNSLNLNWSAIAEGQPVGINIVNQLGQVVSQTHLENGAVGSYQIDLTDIRSGQYFVQFIAEGQAPIVQKLTVVK